MSAKQKIGFLCQRREMPQVAHPLPGSRTSISYAFVKGDTYLITASSGGKLRNPGGCNSSANLCRTAADVLQTQKGWMKATDLAKTMTAFSKWANSKAKPWYAHEEKSVALC